MLDGGMLDGSHKCGASSLARMFVFASEVPGFAAAWYFGNCLFVCVCLLGVFAAGVRAACCSLSGAEKHGTADVGSVSLADAAETPSRSTERSPLAP